MITRPRLSFPLALLLFVCLQAPGTGSQAPTAPSVGTVPESVRIHLAQFDVVVRDAGGRIVPGLVADDFEVVEAGVPLTVVAVDEWGGPVRRNPPKREPTDEAGSAENPERPAGQRAGREDEPGGPIGAAKPVHESRSFVLLFDGVTNASALRLTQARRAASEFARRHLRAGDIAAVYQLDVTLRPVSGFSPDPSAVSRAIDRVRWLPPSSLEDQIAESVLAYRSRPGVSLMGERLAAGAILQNQVLDWQREHFYETLRNVSEVFEGLPGRRVLVLVSAGFPMTTPGDFERARGGFTPAFRDLVKSLAAAGVTVYSVDVGDDLSIGDVSRTIDWRVAAGKLGLDESVLTDIGLDRDFGAGSAGARRQVLGVLAGETGGRLLAHGDLNKAFDLIDEESSRFYRISCNVREHPGDARYRKVTIRVRRSGLQVTARRGRYGDVVPGGGRVQPEGGFVESLSRYATFPVRGGVSLVPSTAPGESTAVIVAEALGPIRFPVDPQGTMRVKIAYDVVARVGDEVVVRSSRSVDAKVAPEGADAVRRGFRVEGQLSLPPGEYDIQATLRIEEPAQFGTWLGRVAVAPETTKTTAGFTSLLLAPDPREASPLLLQAQPVAGSPDPLRLTDGLRVLPSTVSDYAPPGPLVALFWIHGLHTPEGGAPKIRISVRIDDGSPAGRVIPTRLLQFKPDGTGCHRGVVELDLASLAEGAYVLEIEALDHASAGPPARARTPFQVRPPGAEPAAGPSTSS